MKKIISILLSLAMCLSFAACGGSGDTADPAEPVESIDEPVEETSAPVDAEADAEDSDGSEEPEAETPVIPDNDEKGSEMKNEKPAPVEVPKADTTPVIAVGELISTDKCEFSVDYVNITSDVLPPSPGSWYSHYEADSGKVYVDFCVAYKNLDSRDIEADETVSGNLIYADKYEYTGFSMVEKDSRSDFTYSNITSIAPLTTEYVHYLFEVPEEVADSGSGIVLKMTIGDKDYKVVVREGDGSPVAEAEPQTGKTSGEVEVGEVVAARNAEFNVDYSDITAKVTPPHPGSWYSYYEADAGKVYVDVCFAYKNTSDKSVDADEAISAKLRYADKYDYSGFSMIEKDSRSDFTYSNITNIAPLTTEYIHYLFEVPEEVQSSSESIVISFSISGNSYTYTVR